MDTKGGRFTLEINGQTFVGRGTAKVMPNRVGITNDANQDGSGYSTIKAKLVKLELTFDRGSKETQVVRWSDAMLLSFVNVTFKEDDYGVTHLFTRGRWAGENGAEIDTATGEVSGLSIETDSYQAI